MQSLAIRTGQVSRQLRRHLLLILLVGTYTVLAHFIAAQYPTRKSGGEIGVLLFDFGLDVPKMIFFVLFLRLLTLTYVDRSPDRIGELKAEVKGFLVQHDRLASGLLVMVVMTFMMISFARIKGVIPQVNPFSWDVFFMQLDQTLHFGRLPHEYLQMLVSSDAAISVFTGCYNIWLFFVYFSLMIACFMRPESAVRMQFLVAFVLAWAIGGNLLATIFSSAGPVYYADLGLGDTYAALTARLEAQAATGALSVVETQRILWNLYSSDPKVSLISAFPSMHVASSVLMTLFAFSWSRWLGIALTVFASCIMIGSVVLAWHYAIDGYAGAFIAVLCWTFSGWLVRSPMGGYGPATAGS